ncbi:MAG: Fic family protein [Candidatus Doudnabacteria bacterium]|nr:Fic family protein [Candidatus Doudnabacteria bacterium]
MFSPQYKLTNEIVADLMHIAEAKAVIERARLLPQAEVRLRHQALIRMTHSSTAIEGNELNLRQVEAVFAHKKINAPVRGVYEVQNYLKALRYIERIVKEKSAITERVILKIHKLVTDKTLRPDESGHYRKSAVYVVRRKWGFPEEILYTGPDAQKVPHLMADLVGWISKSGEQNINPVIVAGIVHQEIAAIHPFSDGNGRTARALATLVLYARGYDFRRLFALEDYYNKDRPKYYAAINIGRNYEHRRVDFTPWLEYFVRGFREEIDNVKAKIMALSRRKIDGETEKQIYLNPGQLKILDFLDQVGKITVKDVIEILRVPRRTAQLELQKLKKLKMIKQVGKGPASAYVLI